jgi:hypothetical protein
MGNSRQFCDVSDLLYSYDCNVLLPISAWAYVLVILEHLRTCLGLFIKKFLVQFVQSN